MSILINKNTKVITQGMTGNTGTFHTQQALEYGTQMVAGVTPGKGGTTHIGLPNFDTVHEAKAATGRGCERHLRAAPVCCRLDTGSHRRENSVDRGDYRRHSRARHGARQACVCRAASRASSAPTVPACSRPTNARSASCQAAFSRKAAVGVVSRSGTLTYEAVHQTTAVGLGQTTAVGIGGDPVNGTNFIDMLELFLADDETKSIIMIGEIGGSAEEEAAQFIADEAKKGRSKPMVGFIAGLTAPPGRRMGHAGAIVSGGQGGAEDKIAAMEAAGIRVSPSPSELGTTLDAMLKETV